MRLMCVVWTQNGFLMQGQQVPPCYSLHSAAGNRAELQLLSWCVSHWESCTSFSQDSCSYHESAVLDFLENLQQGLQRGVSAIPDLCRTYRLCPKLL